MGKKLGALIKAARVGAALTQVQLAKKLKNVSASDIGRYERGEAEPTQQVVKEIAKICGVTQKSLLDAMPKSKTEKTSKTSSGKTGKTGKTGKIGTSSSSTTPATAKTSMKVTTTEKRLVELYRAADADTKKKVLTLLRGNETTTAGAATGTDALPSIDEVIATLIGAALSKNPNYRCDAAE